MTEFFSGDGLFAGTPYDPLEDQIMVRFAHNLSDAVHGVNEYHGYLSQGMSSYEAFCAVAQSYGLPPELPTGYALDGDTLIKVETAS